MTDKSKNDWDTTHNHIPYILEETVTFGKHHKEMLDAMKAPRELSDEEIIEIADGYWLEENYQIIDFVRQIEKAKTRILANPEVEQSHLTINEIITPRKLSNEEIENIYTKICLEDRNQITTRFARAILKKASEK